MKVYFLVQVLIGGIVNELHNRWKIGCFMMIMEYVDDTTNEHLYRKVHIFADE